MAKKEIKKEIKRVEKEMKKVEAEFIKYIRDNAESIAHEILYVDMHSMTSFKEEWVDEMQELQEELQELEEELEEDEEEE